VVSHELLEILRCPNCVRDGPDAGLLDHVGSWLICHDCERKYPIRDDIPVMLIEEGDRFRDLRREELPEVPPPEERKPLALEPVAPASGDDRRKLILALLGLVAGVGLVVLIILWLQKRANE
jgi:uncharacterized protein